MSYTTAQIIQQNKVFREAYLSGKITLTQFERAMMFQTQALVEAKRREEQQQQQTPTPQTKQPAAYPPQVYGVTYGTATTPQPTPLKPTTYAPQVYGVTYGTKQTPRPLTVQQEESRVFYSRIGYPEYGTKYATFDVPAGYRVSKLKETPTGLQAAFQPKPKPLGLGEGSFLAVDIFKKIVMQKFNIKEDSLGEALLEYGPLSQAYFGSGIAGATEANIYGAASLVTSIGKSVASGKLQYQPAWEMQVSPTPTGATFNAVLGGGGEGELLEERPLAYKFGSVFGEAGYNVAVSYGIGKGVSFVAKKTVVPAAEKFLTKQYLAKGPLAWKGKTESFVMRVTGARPYVAQGILGESLGMPLELVELAGPRSSAIYVAQAPSRGLSRQIVSVPVKAVFGVTEFGAKTMDVRGLQRYQEAVDVAWDLELTPKSSGLTISKTPFFKEVTSQHMVHLISRQGYTTVGSFMYEKPFVEGLLSAPQNILVFTTAKQALAYRNEVPYLPKVSSGKSWVSPQLYVPSTVRSTGKSGLLFAPAVSLSLTPKLNVKPVQRLTREERFESLVRNLPKYEPVLGKKEKAVYVPRALVSTVQQQKTVPVLKAPALTVPTSLTVPSAPAPKLKVPSPPAPKIPTFNIPKFKPPTVSPYFPRFGGTPEFGFGRVRRGRWFEKKHRIKTHVEMRKTILGGSVRKRKSSKRGKRRRKR